MRSRWKPILLVLLAAVLYGASAPFTKLLLEQVEPIVLSSLLYLGAGLGVTLLRFGWHASGQAQKEARLNAREWPWLTASVLVGGVLAPIVLMFSMRSTPAATASLLINFEGVATAMLGVWIFHEHVSRRAWFSILVVTGASILLSLDMASPWGFSLGTLGVVTAYLLWGFDNHVSRHLSIKDPLMLVSFRGIVAGTISLGLAILFGQAFPSWQGWLFGILLGFLSYGSALVFFIFSMRDLGATRAMSFFSAAPFVGAALSFAIFRQLPNAFFWVSLPFMMIGAWLLATENHSHPHEHAFQEHEHRHHHNDGHHGHHPKEDATSPLSHSHWHRHERLVHEHSHLPDLHHRHGHGRRGTPKEE
ncbi:MAG: DMT family transporter [Coprothermobacterota bacterium]|nr:DMT family transporter [Coprothermobacterota bacterium]